MQMYTSSSHVKFSNVIISIKLTTVTCRIHLQRREKAFSLGNGYFLALKLLIICNFSWSFLSYKEKNKSIRL